MKGCARIETDSDLDAFVNKLASQETQTLAMDFEGEFNLHEYGERLCLIQIYDKKEFYIVDPLKVGRTSIRTFLGDRKVLKLFFGAGSDVQLIYKQYDLPVTSVLDLQILARILGYKNLGLDSLLQECLGISSTTKKKHHQMTNWTVRPISDTDLDYALKDVAYLFSLFDFFVDRIEKSKNIGETIRQLILQTPSPLSDGMPSVFRSPEFKVLNQGQKAQFEEIVNIRERLAVELNWPPDNIFAKAQIAKYVSGKLKLDDIPKPKRMTEKCYVKLKELVKATRSGLDNFR